MLDCLKLDSATLFEELFDVLPQPVLLCSTDWRILAANRAAGRYVPLASGRALGADFQNVFRGDPPQESGMGRRRRVMEWRAEMASDGQGTRHFQIRAHLLAQAGWAVFLDESGAGAAVPDFVGQSLAITELLEFVSRIAVSKASSILLQGESGTGKELIAKRLHALSSRAGDRFVALNCAAVPETLLESELFGYEKGAFTDASAQKTGLLELADQGTLFLDEIGEMPLSIQAKLLRVLEDRSYRPLGSIAERRVDVRVVAATNRNLERSIEERTFRADLYYRLNIVQIRIPPLRERPEDIATLAMFFLEQFSRSHGRSVHAFHPSALRLLVNYPWPGNVRELRNVIERAVLVEDSEMIGPGALNLPWAPAATNPAPKEAREAGAPLCLRTSERDLIAAALAQTEGNQTRAAALLGIGRFSLRYKMRKFGML